MILFLEATALAATTVHVNSPAPSSSIHACPLVVQSVLKTNIHSLILPTASQR